MFLADDWPRGELYYDCSHQFRLIIIGTYEAVWYVGFQLWLI